MAKGVYGDQKLLGKLGFDGLEPVAVGPLLGNVSVGDITLAVDVAGNDDDPERPARIMSGDWTAHPFATPQAAIDALPKTMPHQLVINVGAGTFPGWVFNGFTFLGQTPPKITGTRDTFTPATGPSSGTPTGDAPPGGTSGMFVMSDAGWTPGDLIGKYVRFTGGGLAGYTYPIRENTADTIYLSYNAWVQTDCTFVIEDVVTVCNTIPATYFDVVNVANSQCLWALEITNFKVPFVSGSTYGAGFVSYLTNVTFNYCVVEAMPYGFWGYVAELVNFNFCAVVNCTYVGFGLVGVWSHYGSGNFARSCMWGLYGSDCNALSFDVFYGTTCTYGIYSSGVQLFSVGSWGLVLYGCDTAVFGQYSKFDFAHVIINNTITKTFDLFECHVRHRAGQMTGSGNAGWGLNLRGVGNSFWDDSFGTLSLTGASGDLTVDGTTPITWTQAWAYRTFVDADTGARIRIG